MVSLFQHQEQALAETEGMTHVAYYHDMGLGKTFTGAEKMLRLGARVNLVVCQKSKVDDWCKHFEDNYKDCVTVWNITNELGLEFFIDHVQRGSHPVVGIINYDLLWRRGELIGLNRFDFTLMLDESSLIQNERAKRSKFILSLKPANVILLSGTPTGGKYERLWSQMHLLGWGISREMYWRQFVRVRMLDNVGKRGIPIVTGYKNVTRLKRKMREHGCHFLKTSEVFDMPTQTFSKVLVDSSVAYKAFRRKSIVEVEGCELVGDTTLTKMLYERQLCGIYSKAKLEVFRELLEGTDDRVVVFYNFNLELERLRAVCEALGKPVSVVNGKVRDMCAYNVRDDSVTLVQYQAGAMGLNLQQANKVIYYTLPLSSELYEQSKKRIHRIGQDRPCFYYLLLCRGSIDEHILAALDARQDYTEKLFEKESEQ